MPQTQSRVSLDEDDDEDDHVDDNDDVKQ